MWLEEVSPSPCGLASNSRAACRFRPTEVANVPRRVALLVRREGDERAESLGTETGAWGAERCLTRKVPWLGEDAKRRMDVGGLPRGSEGAERAYGVNVEIAVWGARKRKVEQVAREHCVARWSTG